MRLRSRSAKVQTDDRRATRTPAVCLGGETRRRQEQAGMFCSRVAVAARWRALARHPAVVGGHLSAYGDGVSEPPCGCWLWSLVGGPSKWTKSALRWRHRQQRRLKDRARLTQRIGPLLSATRLEDRARFTCLGTAVVRDTMLADGAGEEAAMSRRALRTASRPCPAMEQTGRQETVREVTRRRRRGGTARHWRVLGSAS